MAKIPNIIQRRELEPLLFKANKLVKHYERATNCTASVMGADTNTPDWKLCCVQICTFCKQCKVGTDKNTGKRACYNTHTEAVNEAKLLGGSNIYVCQERITFWTSPFYSGERFAGAFLSGGIQGADKNNAKIKALANMMLTCADQVSRGTTGTRLIQNIGELITEPVIHLDDHTEKSNNDVITAELERSLLANLRRGDNNEAEKIIKRLLNVHYREVNQNFSAFRLKALELAVLLSRAASETNNINENIVFENNNRYLTKIETSKHYQELTEILVDFTEKISGIMFSFHGVRHFPALRKAERYIWDNYTRKLSLREIADASGLSAPYFSTIFKEEMGENLSNYLNRLRVEKAAEMLIITNMPISEIASACGFEDQSWFSKIFKNNTGLTPGKYRDQGNITGINA
jgi:AraC-like DNA-binding protein/ligand-binding sensor protein